MYGNVAWPCDGAELHRRCAWNSERKEAQTGRKHSGGAKEADERVTDLIAQEGPTGNLISAIVCQRNQHHEEIAVGPTDYVIVTLGSMTM